jgi:hypothetical protein
MPNRTEYMHLPLEEAIRHLADLHYAERTRHLSNDEYRLLQHAADVLESEAPGRPSYP